MTRLPLLLFRAARPQQWTKNGFVLAALVFSNRLLDLPLLADALLAAACFCLVSSGTYVFNDILDREADRLHPRKRLRPIASGELAPRVAGLWGGLLLFAGLLLSHSLPLSFNLTLLAYLALQMAYTWWLKHLILLDIFAIALGFVLRTVGGAFAIGVSISSWLVLCALLLALFLGFAKRRHELTLMGEEARDHRLSLEGYSVPLLDHFLAIIGAAAIVAYSFYTLSPEVEARLGTRHLVLTVPFVLYGILRYLFLVHRREEGGNPSRTLLTDGPLVVSVLLWGATAVALIYFVH